MQQLGFLLVLTVWLYCQETTAKPAACSDGKTFCEGCQCCPDLTTCPEAHTLAIVCPRCPRDPICSDGSRCDGCQCCPDLTTCPSEKYKQEGCPFKCPKDPGYIPTPTQNPLTRPPTVAPTLVPNPITSVNEPSPPPPAGATTKGPEITEHRITFVNQCPHDIWAAGVNAPSKTLPKNGGWFMKQNGSPFTVTVPRDWSGRFWARTDCTETPSGQTICATGDCGRKFECNGAGGEPPVTLAEFNLAGQGGLDYYDVSLVDGFNVPIMIKPVRHSYVPGTGSCTACGCDKDAKLDCPPELRFLSKGKTVGCNSACSAFKEHRFCCTGDYDCATYSYCSTGMKVCDPKGWPVDYTQMFRNSCPLAYTYAYDDPSNTLSCLGKPATHFEVIFCP